MSQYLLRVPGLKILLSERFTQDPLELFFGQQRQRGGGRDNPSVQQFLQATQSIRVQRSTAPLTRSNVRASKYHATNDDTLAPIPKRKRERKT